jgi:hypothetical protein
MSSSQIALTVLGAKWLVASLLVTSAMLRIAARPRRRLWHYALAWVVCTAVLAALLAATDNATGRGDTSRRIADVFLAAGVTVLALGGGWAWTSRAQWAHTGKVVRFLTLLLVHAVIILLAALPII